MHDSGNFRMCLFYFFDHLSLVWGGENVVISWGKIAGPRVEHLKFTVIISGMFLSHYKHDDVCDRPILSHSYSLLGIKKKKNDLNPG